MRSIKRLALLTVMLAVFWMLTACGSTEATTSTEKKEEAAQTETISEESLVPAEESTAEESSQAETVSENVPAEETAKEESIVEEPPVNSPAEEPAETSENNQEADNSSPDEIVGNYEVRPVEIFKITAEVYDEEGNIFMHIISSGGEDYLYLLDGNVYAYDPSQNIRSKDPYFTFVFENGKLTLTNMEQTDATIFTKIGLE